MPVIYFGFGVGNLMCYGRSMAWGYGVGWLSPFLFVLWDWGFFEELVGVGKGTTVMEASLVFRRLGQAFLDTIPPLIM